MKQRSDTSRIVDTQDVNAITKDAPVSVVIIGLNEEKYLGECIQSVKDSVDVGIDSIIYVDSGSSDASVDIAVKHDVTVVNISNPYRSPGYSRNIGLEEVKTRFVLFIDGDMVLDAGFLAAALPKFNEPDIACVFGGIVERYPTKDIFHRGVSIDWREARRGERITPAGGGLFRVDDMRTTGGYNSMIPAGEEIELKNRLLESGRKLICIDHNMALHDLDMNGIAGLWRRAQREGELQAYAMLHPEIESIRRYARLARKNNILVIGGIIAMIAVVIFLDWTAAALVAGTIAVAFAVRVIGRCRESIDPLGRFINFIFLYAKKPVQVLYQLRYLLKDKISTS